LPPSLIASGQRTEDRVKAGDRRKGGDIFRDLMRSRRRRAFHAWQVELTTRCGLRCAMCVRAGGEDMPVADMALEDFRKLGPYFSDVEAVVLEGWGEPLLYPSLVDCVRFVKSSGAGAGFVTSGQGLDEAYARELIDGGTDFMGFSFSGATAETHNRIRAGSDLAELAERVRLVSRLKEEGKSNTPRIHLVYLMMKENMDELPDFVGLAHGLGIGEIVLLNQIVATNARQEEERVYGSPEAVRFHAILDETAVRAAGYGIRLVRPSLYPAEAAVCAEDPLRNLYISVTGDVSPCVFLNLPLRDRPPGEGSPDRTKPVTFGNVFKQPFPGIWDSAAYRIFREKFGARKRALDDIHARLGGMGLSFPSVDDALSPPPEACEGCLRLMGA